jgi:hypothetical protein
MKRSGQPFLASVLTVKWKRSAGHESGVPVLSSLQCRASRTLWSVAFVSTSSAATVTATLRTVEGILLAVSWFGQQNAEWTGVVEIRTVK